jgi:hypothetical protein
MMGYLGVKLRDLLSAGPQEVQAHVHAMSGLMSKVLVEELRDV